MPVLSLFYAHSMTMLRTKSENFKDTSSSNQPTNTASPITSPSSSIFLPPSDPYESIRDELLNTTELVAMQLTLAPSNSPAPSVSTPQSIHTGPHFWPSYSPPSWLPPSQPHHKPAPSAEAANFNEFIAFVGWYAVLILCCLVPTACAYQRRRRNARILQQSLQNMQQRLDDLDRMGGLDGLMEGSPARGFRGGEMLDLGENRNRDWEFLEQLFGSATGADADIIHIRRRTLLADVLSGMSVRMLVEREERRRAERGARLVAALKETSMEVKQCHLIPKHAAFTNDVVSSDVTHQTTIAKPPSDGHIELPSLSEVRSHTDNCTDDAIDIEEQSASCLDTGREAEFNTGDPFKSEKAQVVVSPALENNSDSLSDPETAKSLNIDKTTDRAGALIEEATETPQQQSDDQEASPPCTSTLYSQNDEQVDTINPQSLYDVGDFTMMMMTTMTIHTVHFVSLAQTMREKSPLHH
eukprot:CCRYP_002293-RA/>CCRYP_002293-RA protein AED:0.03 eAED:0.03 QI:1476/1/1/1/1/1/2/716/468